MPAHLANLALETIPQINTALTLAAAAFVDSIVSAYPAIPVPGGNLPLIKEAVKLVMSGQDIFLIKYNSKMAIIEYSDSTNLLYSPTGTLTIVSEVPGKPSVIIGREDVTYVYSLSTLNWPTFLQFCTSPVL
jgi:hypothetical protein